MAGKAKHVANREIPDTRFNRAYTGSTSIHCARRVNQTSRENIKNSNYMSSSGGTFNGAFGSIEDSLTISSGILDLTDDSTGVIKKRRIIHINPESATTDTLDGIESDGEELDYQELIILGVSGDTITITHDGTVSGTEREILCPDDSDYTLSGDEALYLVYDNSVSKWVIITNAGDDLGDHVADREIEFSKISAPASLDRPVIYANDDTFASLVFNVTDSGSAGFEFHFDGTEKVALNQGGITVTADDTRSQLELRRSDSTPNDDDILGQINFQGPQTTPITINYARIEGVSRDVTASTEDGGLLFEVYSGGTLTTMFELNSNKIGFFGATPVVQRSAYTVTNHITDRSYDANSTTVAELADVLGTLIVDLRSLGLIAT